MKTIALCLLVVLASAAFGGRRHQQILRLEKKNAELRQAAEEMRECQRACDRVVRTQVDTNELARLRDEWSELMRLRSELGRMRQMARLDLPKLEDQTRSTLEQAAQEKQRTNDLRCSVTTRIRLGLTSRPHSHALQRIAPQPFFPLVNAAGRCHTLRASNGPFHVLSDDSRP